MTRVLRPKTISFKLTGNKYIPGKGRERERHSIKQSKIENIVGGKCNKIKALIRPVFLSSSQKT